jgi:hypothetical protein
MAAKIQAVQYFNVTVADRPGAAHSVLSQLRGAGVNLLAFSAVPLGPDAAQLVLFPEDVGLLQQLSHDLGLNLAGPYAAFLVQGDDELGALADVHLRLAEASVNIFASHGVTDGRGGFGYLLYVRPEQFGPARRALGI